MGAYRCICYRSQGHQAVLIFSNRPDARGDVRIGEERPSQQRDGQDDESDGYCFVHENSKAQVVPNLNMYKYQHIGELC